MTEQTVGNRRKISHLIAASRRWVTANRQSVMWITIVNLIIIGGVLLWKYIWTNPAPADKASDPSVVISTFITLYGLFIGGFGVLVGFVVKRRHVKEFWTILAIFFLVEAAFMDLWRVLDSTDDLYKAATSGLNYYALNDTVHDFSAYFLINVLVVAFGVLVACLPPGRPMKPGRAMPTSSTGICK